MSIGAGVLRFNLSPVLTLCLFDGSSEGIAGFLIHYLKAPFSSVWMLPVIHGFWLVAEAREQAELDTAMLLSHTVSVVCMNPVPGN